MRAFIFCLALPLLGQQTDWVAQIRNKPFADIRQTNWSQAVAAAVSTGPNTITLTPCPIGVSGSATNLPIRISTGTAETVLVTGGTCTSGAATGNITFSAAHTHSSPVTFGSATTGIREAILAGQHTVYVPEGSWPVWAETYVDAGYGMTVECADAFTTAINANDPVQNTFSVFMTSPFTIHNCTLGASVTKLAGAGIAIYGTPNQNKITSASCSGGTATIAFSGTVTVAAGQLVAIQGVPVASGSATYNGTFPTTTTGTVSSLQYTTTCPGYTASTGRLISNGSSSPPANANSTVDHCFFTNLYNGMDIEMAANWMVKGNSQFGAPGAIPSFQGPITNYGILCNQIGNSDNSGGTVRDTYFGGGGFGIAIKIPSCAGIQVGPANNFINWQSMVDLDWISPTSGTEIFINDNQFTAWLATGYGVRVAIEPIASGAIFGSINITGNYFGGNPTSPYSRNTPAIYAYGSNATNLLYDLLILGNTMTAPIKIGNYLGFGALVEANQMDGNDPSITNALLDTSAATYGAGQRDISITLANNTTRAPFGPSYTGSTQTVISDATGSDNGTSFGNLPATAQNGSYVWCPNCTVNNPCNSGSGTGAMAHRVGGAWNCAAY